MSAANIAAKLGGAYPSGAWWRCRCPAHGSRGATLAIRDGDRGGLIVYCHGNCRRDEILGALRRLGLLDQLRDQSAEPPDPAALARRRAAQERDRQRRITLARDMIAAGRPDYRKLNGKTVITAASIEQLVAELPKVG